jgi:hypothetical protein
MRVQLRDHPEHRHHALLHLLKLSVCPLRYAINEPNKTLLSRSSLSGGLSLYLGKLCLVGSPGLLLSYPILSLLSDKLLEERGQLGRLSHLGLSNSGSRS